MRFITMMIPLTLICSLLSGCGNLEAQTAVEAVESKDQVAKEEITTENEIKSEIKSESNNKDLVKNLNDYETIILEDIKESHEISIKFPEFNYAPLDKIISDNSNKEFEGVIEQAEIYWLDEHYEDTRYFYNTTFDEPYISKDIVSIYFDGRFYQGGGHSFSHTINFNLKDEVLITLDDVLKEHSTSLTVIADLVSEKLINDENYAEHRPNPVTEKYIEDVIEETMPEESNYSSFTLTDDSITFYKQYYSLFPNSEGIVGIEITWDEVEEYTRLEENDAQNTEPVNYEFGDPIEPELTLEYIDEDYGFSLTVPESWRGNYIIRETSLDEIHNAPADLSKVLAFSMVEDGGYIGDLFFIEVFEGVSEEDAKGFSDYGGFGGFVAAGNGVALAHRWVGEMPGPLYEVPYIETGNQFAIMAQDDRTDILQTVEFLQMED